MPWCNNMAHIYAGNAAAGACERNGQAHRNHKPDHSISSTCFDKFAPWFIVIFAKIVLYRQSKGCFSAVFGTGPVIITGLIFFLLEEMKWTIMLTFQTMAADRW